MPVDLDLVAKSLTDEQMELLLRKYALKQLSNVDDASHAVFFIWAGDKYAASWTIKVRSDKTSYDTTDTKGDILALCATEAVRRRQADQSNKLLLIEAPAPVPSLDDEILF